MVLDIIFKQCRPTGIYNMILMLSIILYVVLEQNVLLLTSRWTNQLSGQVMVPAWLIFLFMRSQTSVIL